MEKYTLLGGISIACLLGGIACSGQAPGVDSTGASASAVTALTPASTGAGASAAAPASAALVTVRTTTWPDAECLLSVKGTSSPPMQLVADATGVVSFLAPPGASASAQANVSLACKDDTGRTGTFTVDLSGRTAAAAPAVALPAASVRPALTGDVMQYSQAELWAGGYGLRPDPTAQPAIFALWKKASTAPGHLASQKIHSMHGSMFSTTNENGFNWSGGAIDDANSSVKYDAAIYAFAVPGPSGPAPTVCTNAGMWGGLGGVNPSGTLMQTGVIITYAPSPIGPIGVVEPFVQFPAATLQGSSCYDNFCEFGFSEGIAVGDEMLGESFSCDGSGNLNINGANGCFFLEDTSTGSSGSTVLPKIDTFLGETAEAIIENSSTEAEFCGSSGQLYDFGFAQMYMEALRSDSNSTIHDYQTDDSISFFASNGSDQLDAVAVDAPEPDGVLFGWDRGN
jgi:hypothetical protein